MSRPAPETASICAGTLSALGASVCCVLPLALIGIGVGGAWVAQLRSFERFYPVFVGAAVAAFAYAFYRLYLKPAPCAPDAACATPVTRRDRRIAFWVTLLSAKALILFPVLYGHFAS
jgi:mercuric ion transport protein